MWVLRAFLAVAALALLAPAPASALQNKIPIVAYGEGTTTECMVTVNSIHRMFWGGEQRYDFSGRTECEIPVEQSGRVWLNNSTPSLVEYGPLCSGFRATCSSSGYVQGEDYRSGVGSATYHVTLLAPRNQGWVTAPHECFGVGSNNLECFFNTVSDQDTLIFNDV